jgi:hypothetical protein
VSASFGGSFSLAAPFVGGCGCCYTILLAGVAVFTQFCWRMWLFLHNFVGGCGGFNTILLAGVAVFTQFCWRMWMFLHN